MSLKAFSMFHEILEKFQQALTALDYKTDPTKLESLTAMVFEGMSARTRFYHSAQHALNLANNGDPIEILAALYHDLVYYQVDHGLAPHIYAIIEDYFVVENNAFQLRDQALREDPCVRFVYAVFGHDMDTPRSPLAAQNEFLSAFVAAKELESVLKPVDLVQVLVCIEATIPFRPVDASGHGCLERLAERLEALNRHDLNGLVAVEDAIHRAVRIANRDVENFSSEDVGRFLDNTWQLIPEINPSLQNAMLYTIRDYRIALEKMEDFFRHLDPAVVFYSFRNVPDAVELKTLTRRTKHNLTIARAYLQVKLYTIALLEALAEETGGNVALVFFMGDIRHQGEGGVRLEDFLHDPDVRVPADELEPTVLMLLEKGRTGESSYDVKTSPISAFLYRSLGKSSISAGLEQARLMFKRKLSCASFLKQQDQYIVSELSRACSYVAFTRKQRLLDLIKH